MRMPRLRIRTLMIVVLVVGLLCGSVARWRAREVRREQLLAELRVQEQVTNSALRQIVAEINYPAREGFSCSTANSFNYRAWSSEVEAHETAGRDSTPLLYVEVSGGCDDESLRPIVISTSGASLDEELATRLVQAFVARGWPHVVSTSPRFEGK